MGSNSLKMEGKLEEENYDRELARVIDHTLLKTDARKEDFDRVCEEAKRYHFRSVCSKLMMPSRTAVPRR